MEPTTSLSELFPTATAAATKKNGELGQEDFMRLMVAQLENQDPTKPMDNFEFLSQIAQFGTVSGIQSLDQGFANLASVLYANQALEAASLVGRQVMTDSNVGLLVPGETLDATIDLPQPATEVTLFIEDMTGRLVHTESLGQAAAGELKVQWNGLDDDGNPFAGGEYRVSAHVVMAGQNRAVSVYAHSTVESVTIDAAGTGVIVNLTGGAQVGLAEIKSYL